MSYHSIVDRGGKMAFDMIIDNTYALSDKKIYMPTRPAIPPNTKRMHGKRHETIGTT
mgnify:CR=1 FL=1